MLPPHGPHRIGKTRQIAIPDALLKAVRLQQGDEVYFTTGEVPGTLLIVPVEIASTWFERGRGEQARAEEAR